MAGTSAIYPGVLVMASIPDLFQASRSCINRFQVDIPQASSVDAERQIEIIFMRTTGNRKGFWRSQSGLNKVLASILFTLYLTAISYGSVYLYSCTNNSVVICTGTSPRSIHALISLELVLSSSFSSSLLPPSSSSSLLSKARLRSPE